MRLRFQSNYLGWLKPGNYFENSTACSKRTMKTTDATQLKRLQTMNHSAYYDLNSISCENKTLKVVIQNLHLTQQ